MFFGCEKDDVTPVLSDVSIEIKPELLNLTHEASTQTLAVTANKEWGVSSSESWCSVSPGVGIVTGKQIGRAHV